MVTPDPNVDAVNKVMFQFSGRNLSGSGEKCPVIDFIANGLDWDVKPSPWGRKDENFIVFKFDKLQVLQIRPDAPAYPYDIVELQIKHSQALRSGFGFVTASINKALSRETGDSDIDDFKSQMWRVTMSMYNWGTIDGKPDQMGEIWNFSLANVAGGAAAPVNSPAPTPTPAVVAPETVQPSEGVSTSTQSPEARALELLHGKTNAQFIPEVVVDTKVREDGNLFTSIIQMTWLAEKIADGTVTLGEDGVHTVVKG